MTIFKSIAPFAISALVLAALPAAAEGWQEYNHPELGFAVSFPAEPAQTSGSYQTASGTVLPATIFSVQQDNITYTLTIADFSSAKSEQASAIDDAVKMAARRGDVKMDVEERVDQHYGHALTVAGADSSLSSVAIFFFNNRLYLIEGTAVPPDADNSSSTLLRFQQSLQFSGTPGLPSRGPGRGPGPGPAGGSSDPVAGLARRQPPAQAFEDCRGKKEGDAVQHTTPRGIVPSTCIVTPQGLAARPDMPLDRPAGDQRPQAGRARG